MRSIQLVGGTQQRSLGSFDCLGTAGHRQNTSPFSLCSTLPAPSTASETAGLIGATVSGRADDPVWIFNLHSVGYRIPKPGD